jgi:UDP-N-acetylglucosamine 2-epimerase (non-hydrolysing)
MNRQVTGRIAEYDFAPTPLSRQNLLDEGVSEEKITVTGNTVIDALHWVVKNVMEKGYKPSDPLVASLPQDDRRMVLITGHRRENFGEGFISMCTAIRDLARKYPEVDFVYPMHLNPNVRKPIREVFGMEISQQARNDKGRNLFFIEPLDYLDFVYLMSRSYIVLTDSGGIQEEAPGLGKPVLVMRDTTERPEALDAGTVRLVGTDYDKIVSEVSALLDDRHHYEAMSHAVNPYGDGKACPRIVEKLK